MADKGILVDESGSAVAFVSATRQKMASVVSPIVALKGLWKFGAGPLLRALQLLALFENTTMNRIIFISLPSEIDPRFGNGLWFGTDEGSS